MLCMLPGKFGTVGRMLRVPLFVSPSAKTFSAHQQAATSTAAQDAVTDKEETYVVIPSRHKGRRGFRKIKPEVEDQLTDFRHTLPDFLPYSNFDWRHPIREKLERMDMLRRREHIEIPEFYVGSILAVTVSDAHSQNGRHRFVGICIDRAQRGLKHFFVLRNVIDGLGFEIRYDMYSPLLLQIEVLKLEKRLDSQLLYLRDALPEYSTVPFNMKPVPHSKGSPVPLNPLKVKLIPEKNWHQRWQIKPEILGIERPLEPIGIPELMARSTKSKIPYAESMDLMKSYRSEIPKEDQAEILEEMLEVEQDFLKRNTDERRKELFPKPTRS